MIILFQSYIGGYKMILVLFPPGEISNIIEM